MDRPCAKVLPPAKRLLWSPWPAGPAVTEPSAELHAALHAHGFDAGQGLHPDSHAADQIAAGLEGLLHTDARTHQGGAGILHQVDEALQGLINLVQDAGATLVGAGICVEKAFQPGGDLIRGMGVRVESLARIKAMSVEGGVEFC